MKMIEVVAAIIERDGKILLAQRPAQSDQAGFYRKLQKKEAISGKGISPTNTSGYKYYCAAGVLAGC